MRIHSHRGFEGGSFSVSFFSSRFFLRRALSTQGVRILEDDVYSGRKEDADDDGQKGKGKVLGVTKTREGSAAGRHRS